MNEPDLATTEPVSHKFTIVTLLAFSSKDKIVSLCVAMHYTHSVYQKLSKDSQWTSRMQLENKL